MILLSGKEREALLDSVTLNDAVSCLRDQGWEDVRLVRVEGRYWFRAKRDNQTRHFSVDRVALQVLGGP